MTPPVAAARVLVAGATGLVGRALVEVLQRDPRVAALTLLQRRAAAADTTPRTRRLAVDFEALDAAPAAGFAAEAAFCALGTTIRVAGSQAAFRRVDHDYAVGFARRAREAGVTRFGLVSALGADPRSRVFYNRVKGETEAALRALGFDLLAIARPSLLLGARDEFRLGERLMTPLGRWLPRRWRAIEATQVAQGLVEATLAPGQGVRVRENGELLRG
jgi:uncharacterized protein YbjT (DUF2867 family)